MRSVVLISWASLLSTAICGGAWIGYLATLLVVCFAVPTRAGEFYIAPNGSDANPGTKDKPLATIAHARDMVRQAKTASKGPIRVWVRGGTYYLEKMLAFGSNDSGTEKSPIIYAAAEGEKAILSGGRQITGWKPFRGKIWQCDLKTLGLNETKFKELYYNGRGQPSARVPNIDPKHPRTGGFLYVADGGQQGSKRVLKYNPAKINPSKWAHPQRAEVVVFPYHNWGSQVISIAKIDPVGHTVTLDADAQFELISDARFYVYNVFEELDTPGEWYLDHEAGTLYFWPPDDGLLQGSVVVPTTDTVIEIKGSTADKVLASHLEFHGFFIQACRGPAISLVAAEYCTIAKNTITNIGFAADAVVLASSKLNCVVGNDIAYTGVGGIRVAEGSDSNLITNNYIHDVGLVIRQGAPIGIGGRANMVSHNLIHDVPYVGIRIFYGVDNILEYNEIHHVGMETNVPGGIYAYIAKKADSDAMKGTIIRFNKISDAVGYGMMWLGNDIGKWGPNFGFGVWWDDWVSNTAIYGNILVRNRGGSVLIHGGTNNLVENNILGAGVLGEINHLRPGKDPCNNRILRNIVYYPNADSSGLFQYGWTQTAKARAVRGDAIPVFLCGWTFNEAAVAESDYNLLFPIRGSDVEWLYCFRGAAKKLIAGPWVDAPVADRFAWWRQQGFEAHSLVGDPLFVDASKDDYRLRPESPALKLGFKPIPIKEIGLQPVLERASWPVDSQQDRWREEPEVHPQ